VDVAVERALFHQERIVRDPKVLAGKPVVLGTRIPVDLVIAKLAANSNLAELFADYPRLRLDDVCVCLEYARWPGSTSGDSDRSAIRIRQSPVSLARTLR
jgi:uncharacterized protein (DUF433 family)